DGANAVAGTVTAADADTLQFQPAAPLAPARLYFATLSTGVTDTSGNAMAQPYYFSFTSESLPAIAHVQPGFGAAGVAIQAKLFVTFTKAIAGTIAVTDPANPSVAQAFTITNSSVAFV